MLEDNEASVDLGGVAEDVVEVLHDLRRRNCATVDVEIAGIERRSCTDTSPHHWSKLHGLRNGTDTVAKQQRLAPNT